MLQCLRECSAYRSKVGKLEASIIPYLQPLAQLTVLTQIEPLAHRLIVRTSVERILKGVLTLQLCLENISHLRHPWEMALGSVVGNHRKWNQCFWVGVADLPPESLEVVIEVVPARRPTGAVIEIVGRVV